MKNNGAIPKCLVLILTAAVVLSVLGMAIGTLIQIPPSAPEASVTSDDDIGESSIPDVSTDGHREFKHKTSEGRIVGDVATLGDIGESAASGTNTDGHREYKRKLGIKPDNSKRRE